MSRSSSFRWVVLSAVTAAIVGGIFYGPEVAGKIAYAINSSQIAAEREKLAQMRQQDTLSPLFEQVAKVVMPAVVEVRVTKRIDAPAPMEMDEFFRRFFGENGQRPGPQRPRAPMQREVRGLGSGVIVDAKNGYVVTNNHVVGGADHVEVITSDNRRLEAEWIRTDPATDIAIVKIKADSLVDAPLGDSDAMQVGHHVLAIGSPEGLPQTVTMGIISAKGRNQTGLGGGLNLYQNFLQTDAAINHGNSGGPLVNMQGEVIGINTAIVSRTGVNEGIGLAIPSNMVRRIMSQLIETGKVTRGYLGVRLQEVDPALAKSFNVPASTRGALVADVAQGGPGEQAGLKPGDFIVSVDGQAVTDVNSLRMMVANIQPNSTVPVELYRDGQKTTLPVKVAEQPKDMVSAFTGPLGEGGQADVNKFGIKVTTLTPELAAELGYAREARGVVITEIEAGSSASAQGLERGMLIVRVQDKAVTTAEQFASAVSTKDAAEGIRLQITDPQGNRRFVFITPTKPRQSMTAPVPQQEQE